MAREPPSRGPLLFRELVNRMRASSLVRRPVSIGRQQGFICGSISKARKFGLERAPPVYQRDSKATARLFAYDAGIRRNGDPAIISQVLKGNSLHRLSGGNPRREIRCNADGASSGGANPFVRKAAAQSLLSKSKRNEVAADFATASHVLSCYGCSSPSQLYVNNRVLPLSRAAHHASEYRNPALGIEPFGKEDEGCQVAPLVRSQCPPLSSPQLVDMARSVPHARCRGLRMRPAPLSPHCADETRSASRPGRRGPYIERA